MAIFTCECIDEDGKIVPTASEFVKFHVTEGAKIIGTGSSNCDHNKVTLPDRKMYAGKIAVAVLPDEDCNKFTLYATSESLGTAKIEITLN